MDAVNLHAIGPVGDTQFKSSDGTYGAQVQPWCLLSDEMVGSSGGDVGELPVHASDAVPDENPSAGEGSKCYGGMWPGEAELEAGGSEMGSEG